MAQKVIFIVGAILAVPSFIFLLAFSLQEPESLQFKTLRHAERGIYITHNIAQLPVRFKYLRDEAKKCNINTLVIDLKPLLSKPILALAKDHKMNSSYQVVPDPKVTKMIAQLHEEGFIVSARIPVFKDDWLAIYRPDLALPYRDRKGGRWLNPYKAEARLYNELIAAAAAASGADEVQFDYIRFPAEGDLGRLTFSSQETGGLSKVDVICLFLKEVKERLKNKKTSMAVDIFGVVAWQYKGDIDTLGQDLKKMAPYLEILSPMLYPSHFHPGYDGYSNPGSEPYYFMNMGVVKSLEILSGEAVQLAPWLQAFNMNSPNYGPEYIRQQVKACTDAGVNYYLFWNASNNYDVVFAALRKQGLANK